MSLATTYARTQSSLKRYRSLHQAFHVFRQVELKLDRLVLEHAVVRLLVHSMTPLALGDIQAKLSDRYHLNVSRRVIRRFILKPLCRERCVILTYRPGSPDDTKHLRLYASTPELHEYQDLLESEIVDNGAKLCLCIK